METWQAGSSRRLDGLARFCVMGFSVGLRVRMESTETRVNHG